MPHPVAGDQAIKLGQHEPQDLLVCTDTCSGDQPARMLIKAAVKDADTSQESRSGLTNLVECGVPLQNLYGRTEAKFSVSDALPAARSSTLALITRNAPGGEPTSPDARASPQARSGSH